MAKKHCIVIGSGILGASVAWHLARAGAAVTILEAEQAGGHATRDSWAWINASWGNPQPYFHLRQRAMQEWQRLARQVPDEVVIAAGVGSAALLGSLGLQYTVHMPAGLLVHSKPTRRLLTTLLMTPELHVRQTSEGRLVAGTDFVGSMDGTAPDVMAAQLYQKVQAMVAGSEDVAMDFYTLGQRPTSGDGFPMVGRPKDTAGLYLVLSHSGITLAPALGLFSAQELLNGVRDPLLANYHPDRLLQPIA